MQRVAIIGGGPAGARAAFRLAAEGTSVTLFEPRRDHEKACGGGIPARGLEEYPFLADPGLPVRQVDSILLISPTGREALVPLPEPIGMFRRADLHRVMIEAAVAAGAAERDEMVLETLMAFRRAGCSGVLTYHAAHAARLLQR